MKIEICVRRMRENNFFEMFFINRRAGCPQKPALWFVWFGRKYYLRLLQKAPFYVKLFS